jgi:hypothetical protein
VISFGCCHNFEIRLLVDDGFDAIAQDAVVFYKKNLDLSHPIDLSVVHKYGIEHRRYD